MSLADSHVVIIDDKKQVMFDSCLLVERAHYNVMMCLSADAEDSHRSGVIVQG